MLKRIKEMMSLFVKTTTGILFVTAVYITVFYGWENTSKVNLLWEILGLSALCTLGSLILPLEGEKEVSKAATLIRVILYYIYVNIVTLIFGYAAEWYLISDMKQVLGMVAAVAFVFFVIAAVYYWAQYQEAKKMNQKLRERK